MTPVPPMTLLALRGDGGGRGHAPSDSYKVSATYADGYRATATMMIGGADAARKGQRVADAILTRTRRMFG